VKSFVSAWEGRAEGATIDSTGTEDVGDGEGSGARTVELLRPHEAKTQRVRMKYSGTRRMRLFNDILGTPPTQEKKALSIVIPSDSRGIPSRNGEG
jgi:hypothetical protein